MTSVARKTLRLASRQGWRQHIGHRGLRGSPERMPGQGGVGGKGRQGFVRQPPRLRWGRTRRSSTRRQTAPWAGCPAMVRLTEPGPVRRAGQFPGSYTALIAEISVPSFSASGGGHTALAAEASRAPPTWIVPVHSTVLAGQIFQPVRRPTKPVAYSVRTNRPCSSSIQMAYWSLAILRARKRV